MKIPIPAKALQNKPDGCFHAGLCEPEYLLVQFWKVVARCLLFWWSNDWGEFNFTLTPFNTTTHV